MSDHAHFMREALREAEAALRRGDLPIGAVIRHGDAIVGRGSNARKTGRRHLAHAELEALLSCPEYLEDHHAECIVYSTVEPCPMCLGAIVMADVPQVVFGAFDYRAGATQMVARVPYVAHHLRTYLGGVLEEDCLALVRQYSPVDADIIQGRLHPFRNPTPCAPTFSHAPEGYDCPFCAIARDAQQEQHAVVYADARVTALVPTHHYAGLRGNVLIIPNAHYENVFDIDPDLGAALLRLTQRLAFAMKAAYHCEGISTRQHNEPAGNQDVWHYHLHVFPRFPGDGLYAGRKERYTVEERLHHAALLRKQLRDDE